MFRRAPRILRRGDIRLIVSSVAAAAFAGGFLLFRLLSDDTQLIDPEDINEPGCESSISADFIVVESLSALTNQSDAALLGQVVGRTSVSEIYRPSPVDEVETSQFVLHEVRVKERLLGEVTKPVISIGSDWGLCFAIGADYVLFLNRSRTATEQYVDSAAVYDNPGEFFFHPAGVFMVQDGKVVGTDYAPADVGKGIKLSEFRSKVEAAINPAQ